MDLVRASHLYKVFGKNERQVIERLKAGESREELASLGTAAVIDVSFEVAKGGDLRRHGTVGIRKVHPH